MRQFVGDRKIRKYAAATGLDIVHAMARGNTGHRVQLYVRGGTIWYYWPKTERLEKGTGPLDTWRSRDERQEEDSHS